MTESHQNDGAAGTPVLEVSGLSKAFGATQALADASLRVRAGEVHIMLGENGAGKSTLAKIVAGVHVADGGEIRLCGKTVAPRSTKEARAQGISIIFQELSLAPHLSVVENLFLGTEAGSHPFRRLARAKERERARAMLEELSLDLPLDAQVGALTVGEKQMLEIAKALLQGPRLLIADEPTSALSEHEKVAFFALVRRLRARGTAILYVTHHMREVFEIGDTVSTMRDGRITRTVGVDDRLDEQALIEMLTGRQLGGESRRGPKSSRDIVLQVSGLRTADGCEGVDLTVARGEIVGVYGVVGSGREALARALVGISPPVAGEMSFQGRPYRPRGPSQARMLGLGYLAMDRKEQGILPQRSIRENLSLCSLRQHARLGLIRGDRERRQAQEALKALRVRFGSEEQAITSLSGGNQQKVLIGRALGCDPQVLVMEEPTAGIDIGAKHDIYESIQVRADAGQSFLVLSSDLTETLTLCDRVYTIYRGRLTDEIINPSMADEDRVIAGVLGRAAMPAPAAHVE
ncbi:MAG: sugar ABC transporter ATP-binding protein [Pigmentiphaga sp.]|uniref:sugar ABC transporter ATP-binding protein n=1 Tax=Pigmentiphaga sp. TaxID=1977564 RepID=UPI0029B12943|nr:sugar ABC transporter ATP-binding protein [Pigmentiphaga sp.]MDX3907646.1 sugar ABC transporter ATP-binding protein [Pigmentiphaga sp.]